MVVEPDEADVLFLNICAQDTTSYGIDLQINVRDAMNQANFNARGVKVLVRLKHRDKREEDGKGQN